MTAEWLVTHAKAEGCRLPMLAVVPLQRLQARPHICKVRIKCQDLLQFRDSLLRRSSRLQRARVGVPKVRQPHVHLPLSKRPALEHLDGGLVISLGSEGLPEEGDEEYVLGLLAGHVLQHSDGLIGTARSYQCFCVHQKRSRRRSGGVGHASVVLRFFDSALGSWRRAGCCVADTVQPVPGMPIEV